MKLQALIQIALLLGTSVIPDGQSCVSPGGCGCSDSDRSAGTCCCSSGQSACCSVADLKSKSSGATCCTSKPACCTTTDKEEEPAGKPKPGCCQSRSEKSSSKATGIRSSCPCGKAASFAILLMPRIVNPATRGPQLTGHERRHVNEPPNTGRLKEPPASPPPRLG